MSATGKSGNDDDAARAAPALLEGMRVLDLTTVIMGPFATHILADLGADVIKIESPDGDSTRTHAPHMAPGVTGSFLNLNRNKRSVVLDLKSVSGRTAFNALLKTADVVVHNLRAPVMERLGYTYGYCRSIKPDVIYCAAYGFGAAGPYAAKPAYDDMIQAASGFASLATAIHGEPSYAPAVVCDKLAGQAIATAILAGLVHRARGGGGQQIEVPMFETAIEFNLMEYFGAAAFEPPLGRPGYARIQSKERRPFRTKDGFACIMPYSDRNWRDFFVFTGRLDMVDDPRWARLADRAAHFDRLYGAIREEAVKRTTQEWLAFCDGANIPCMPVIDLGDLPDDPHLRAVGFFTTEKHPHGGAYRSIRRPTTFSAASFELRKHAPLLGEHTQEVLSEAGLSDIDIEAVQRGHDGTRSDNAAENASRRERPGSADGV